MKKNFFNQLRKTFKYASKHERKYLFIYLFIIILISVTEVVVPILSARQIVILTSSLFKQLFLITLCLFLVEIFRNVLMYFSDKYIDVYFFGVKKNIQMELASQMLRIETKTMNKNSSGMFTERMSSDVSTMADIFVTLTYYVTNLIKSIGVLLAVFFINKFIFLLYLLIVIILYIGLYYKSKDIEKIKRENRKIDDEVMGFSSELVRGSKDIKLLNAETSFLKRMNRELKKLNDSDYNYDMAWQKYRFVDRSLWDLSDFIVMAAGILFLVTGNLSIPTMLVIVNYRSDILRLSDSLESLIENVKKYMVSSERVFEIIEDKYPKEKFGDKHINKLKGYIEFKDVTFGYGGENILKNMSFQIKPNETVAFVGKSGVGKTTIYNLISKLYSADSGKVLLDGTHIEELDRETIRKNISVISQNPYIFNMSIKDNLKVIKEDVTDDEIVSACKMAELHNFIISQKDGYDTVVGESGITLSGGQSQRLAIARALIKNTEIILFDEATSALDNETQSKIQSAINSMQGTYTILIIAHRLSTVINADKIFLIADGKVSDIGTHEELLKNNEDYRKMYELELTK